MCEFVVIMPGILSDIFRGKVPCVPVVKIWTIFLIDLYQLLFQRDLSRALDLSVYIQEVTLLAMAEKSFCQDSQTLLSSFLNSYLTARVLQFY